MESTKEKLKECLYAFERFCKNSTIFGCEKKRLAVQPLHCKIWCIAWEIATNAAAERQRKTEWQTIATAPKDGTPFLGYWLRIHSDGERYEAVQPFVVAHYDCQGDINPHWVREDPPTHWSKTPKPPAN